MAISEEQILNDFQAYKICRDDTRTWRVERDKCDKFDAECSIKTVGRVS